MQQNPWRRFVAGNLEYFSIMPTLMPLFEVLRLNHRFAPGRPGKVAKIVNRLRYFPAPCLPQGIRYRLARLNPDYDPELHSWPRRVADFSERRHIKEHLQTLQSRGKWLEYYAYFWSTRRPHISRKIFLPLMQALHYQERPFLATTAVFFWSGLLHAVSAQFLLLYWFLAPMDLALSLFLLIWFGFVFLGLPVALRQSKINKGRNSSLPRLETYSETLKEVKLP